MHLTTNWIILEEYVIYIIAVVFAIYFIVIIFKYFIKNENIFVDKDVSHSTKKVDEKNALRYNIANIIIMLAYIFLIIYVSTIFLADLPNIITNKYEIVECIVSDVYTKSNNTQRQSLYCEDDDGKTIHFVYAGNPLTKDVKIQAYYYKHIEIGQIVKIIEY